MANRFTISLNNVRFRAYHGLYPEERQKGNDFVVNMQVAYAAPEQAILALEDTIDYADLFSIINTTMQQPVDLLETLVQSIALRAKDAFPHITAISVSVEKLNPPIDKFTGTATVSYSVEF